MGLRRSFSTASSDHEGVRPHLRKPAKGRRFVRFCLPPNGVVALTGASQTGFQIVVAVKLRCAIERGGQTAVAPRRTDEALCGAGCEHLFCKKRVDAVIPGQLWVKCCRHDAALAYEDRVASMVGQDFDVFAHCSNDWGSNENHL